MLGHSPLLKAVCKVVVDVVESSFGVGMPKLITPTSQDVVGLLDECVCRRTAYFPSQLFQFPHKPLHIQS